MKREVNVCPACNSQDVDLDDTFKFELRSGLMRHRCNNCGFSGPMTVMDKRHADKIKVHKIKNGRSRPVG